MTSTDASYVCIVRTNGFSMEGLLAWNRAFGCGQGASIGACCMFVGSGSGGVGRCEGRGVGESRTGGGWLRSAGEPPSLHSLAAGNGEPAPSFQRARRERLDVAQAAAAWTQPRGSLSLPSSRPRRGGRVEHVEGVEFAQDPPR